MSNVAAFLSYARHDDTHSNGEITELHRRLLGETRLHFGREVNIFFDRSIEWGTRWKQAIEESLGRVAVLVPILTPAFFQSKYCREEFLSFLAYEKTAGSANLILPIYYIESSEVETPDAFRSDEMVQLLHTRQRVDWRSLRFEPQESLGLKRAFAQQAQRIALIARERTGWSEGNVEASADPSMIQGVADVLGKRVSFESVVAYSVLKFPNKPVSVGWTNELLKDLNLSRYRTISDIDSVVEIARQAVGAYATKRPSMFQYSTDFITKSLIFVDGEFRARHGISPETRVAAEKANITRV